MATKFSNFNLKNSLSGSEFMVGYDGTQNWRAQVSLLFPQVADADGALGFSLFDNAATTGTDIKLRTIAANSSQLSIDDALGHTLYLDVEPEEILPSTIGTNTSNDFFARDKGGLGKDVPNPLPATDGIFMHLDASTAYEWVKLGSNLNLRFESGEAQWYLDAIGGDGGSYTAGPGILIDGSNIISADFGNTTNTVAMGSNRIDFSTNASGQVVFNVTPGSATIGNAVTDIRFDLDIGPEVTNYIWNNIPHWNQIYLRDSSNNITLTPPTLTQGGGLALLEIRSGATGVITTEGLAYNPPTTPTTITIDIDEVALEALGFIKDAPADGTSYVRRDNAWIAEGTP